MEEKPTCPFCQEPHPAEAQACPSCLKPFPWMAAAEKLREEMKERETNRGRATMTLLEEVVGAAKGERPVSLAAVKGFAFAWLFPRALIVLGSIATGLLIAAQTMILYQQTRLLRMQAQSSQVDQAERMRDRIVDTNSLADRLALVSRSLERGGTAIDCEGCAVSMMSAMTELRNEGPGRSVQAGRSLSAGASFLRERLRELEALDQEMESHIEPTKSDSAPARRGTQLSVAVRKQENASEKGSWLIGAVELAQLLCLLPQADAARLRAKFDALGVWSSGSTRWSDETRINQSSELVEILRNAVDDPQLRQHAFRATATTVGQFSQLAATVRAELAQGVGKVVERCRAKSARDLDVLASIER